jgi:hypothetical protein
MYEGLEIVFKTRFTRICNAFFWMEQFWYVNQLNHVLSEFILFYCGFYFLRNWYYRSRYLKILNYHETFRSFSFKIITTLKPYIFLGDFGWVIYFEKILAKISLTYIKIVSFAIEAFNTFLKFFCLSWNSRLFLFINFFKGILGKIELSVNIKRLFKYYI